jgi:hypothetical protein
MLTPLRKLIAMIMALVGHPAGEPRCAPFARGAAQAVAPSPPRKRKGGRPRKHKNRAECDRAYRERKKRVNTCEKTCEKTCDDCEKTCEKTSVDCDKTCEKTPSSRAREEYTITTSAAAAADARARPPPNTDLISETASALADEIMPMFGIDLAFVPPNWCGFAQWLDAGLREGWKVATVRVASQRVAASWRRRQKKEPPEKFTYLAKAIVEQHEAPAPPQPRQPAFPFASNIVEIDHGVRQNAPYRGRGGFARNAVYYAMRAAKTDREGGGAAGDP